MTREICFALSSNDGAAVSAAKELLLRGAVPDPSGITVDTPLDELLSLAANLQAELIELQRGEDDQSAVRNATPKSQTPSLHTGPNLSHPSHSGSADPAPTSTAPEVAGWVRPTIPDSRPGSEFDAPRPSAPEPEPTSPSRPAPAPVLYVYNRLVTEKDVRRCMEDSGDLAAYDLGRITKAEAYRRTLNWVRSAMEMRR